MKTLLLLLFGFATAPLFAGPASLEAPLPAGAHVTVDGARLFYWTEGHGEPLLLVEGGPVAGGRAATRVRTRFPGDARFSSRATQQTLPAPIRGQTLSPRVNSSASTDRRAAPPLPSRDS